MVGYIPGYLITLLTLPGGALYALFVKWCCQLAEVKIYDICYFQTEDAIGYRILFERPKRFSSLFLIATVPFLLGNILGIGMFWIACIPSAILRVIFIWLGFSIIIHCFPDNETAVALWKGARKALKQRKLWAIITYPFTFFVWLINTFSFLWADFIYAALLLYLFSPFRYIFWT